tara:strand:- start:43559 stop:44263 length:705 start_codon:yes stop_codon:yes gene_type:complete
MKLENIVIIEKENKKKCYNLSFSEMDLFLHSQSLLSRNWSGLINLIQDYNFIEIKDLKDEDLFECFTLHYINWNNKKIISFNNSTNAFTFDIHVLYMDFTGKIKYIDDIEAANHCINNFILNVKDSTIENIKFTCQSKDFEKKENNKKIDLFLKTKENTTLSNILSAIHNFKEIEKNPQKAIEYNLEYSVPESCIKDLVIYNIDFDTKNWNLEKYEYCPLKIRDVLIKKIKNFF